MIDYHGFGKVRLSPEVLAKVPSLSGTDLKDIQPEIIRVDRVLTQEVHYHKHAYAFVVCLGKSWNFPDPVAARAFFNGRWSYVESGLAIRIAPGTPHGFTIYSGGILYFLSVQSPPIIGDDGSD